MSNMQVSRIADHASWDLEQWLEHLAIIHPHDIELGLERSAEVYSKLALNMTDLIVVTVAGTNGKGTTCAMLEQAILLSGRTVAVYSSPHIIEYRERVRINGQMLSEQQHCQAFETVENARGDTLLTYFEFGTLAALQLMVDSQADMLILEVGLGGRLDTVNIVEPNIAVITSIDLDHQAWLGDNREDIAREKAGIFRPNIPAVIGELESPNSLYEAASLYQVVGSWQGQDFSYTEDQKGFNWCNNHLRYEGLPLPHIPAQNASTALQVIDLLGLELDRAQLTQLFTQTQLPGRRQIIQHKPMVMLDVAHNPQATRHLASEIAKCEYHKLFLVTAMLADKDIEQSLSPLLNLSAHWLLASLDVPRAAKSTQLNSVLDDGQKVLEFPDVSQAYCQALKMAKPDDLIVVFGSFFTVAKVLKLIQKR
jgi:dihydrofolate synthase/folylpolyglutamate synthase